MYDGSGHFFGFKIQNFEFHFFFLFFFLGWGGGESRKMNIFWGIKICRYFWGSSLNWTIFRGHFYAF